VVVALPGFTASPGLSAVDIDRVDPLALTRRLASSERLRQRRFELLPLSGPAASFTEVQGRSPGDSTSTEGLAELISSIATVGVLQPVLVEEMAGGKAHRLVSGERRLRACRRGAVLDRPAPLASASNQNKLLRAFSTLEFGFWRHHGPCSPFGAFANRNPAPPDPRGRNCCRNT